MLPHRAPVPGPEPGTDADGAGRLGLPGAGGPGGRRGAGHAGGGQGRQEAVEAGTERQTDRQQTPFALAMAA